MPDAVCALCAVLRYDGSPFPLPRQCGGALHPDLPR